MLLGGRFSCVIANMNFHELIQATESVAKRRVLYALLVCDHIVVKGFQASDFVDQKVSVARQLAHRIIEKGQLDDHGQRCQRHHVLPSGKVIVV